MKRLVIDNIPIETYEHAINGFVAQGYQATIPDPDNAGQTIDNPQTPEQFMCERIFNYISEVSKANAVSVAMEQARQQVTAMADDVIAQSKAVVQMRVEDVDA